MGMGLGPGSLQVDINSARLTRQVRPRARRRSRPTRLDRGSARLGASRVVLTDVEALVPGLSRNVEANGLGDRVDVRELVWGSDEFMSRLSELGKFDVVLTSDVLLNPEEKVGLGKTLKRVCGRGTNRVCAACEVRTWTGECLSELVSQGFGVVAFPSQLGPASSSSCSLLEGDGSLDMFAIFNLIPPVEESCHVADICV